MSFKALRVYAETGKASARLESLNVDQLSQGDVLIRSHYSSLNYKDALAITGKGKILKQFPLIAGIDVSGQVISSQDSRFKEGDDVLVTGCGLGETADGGFSEVVRVPADWVVPLPKALSLKEAMIYGTAGFTAGLCLHRLEQNGLTKEKGPVVVTGASGGVGSFATYILSQLGFEVMALTGKAEAHEYLMGLGAKEVCNPKELQLGSRPLESARWAAAIDNVGGDLLAKIFAHIKLWGNVACVGLAGSHELHATVMPLILRGVSLLGISSAHCPYALRKQIWERLANDWRPGELNKVLNQEICLEELEPVAQNMLARQTIGRYLVQLPAAK